MLKLSKGKNGRRGGGFLIPPTHQVPPPPPDVRFRPVCVNYGPVSTSLQLYGLNALQYFRE